MSHEPSFEEFYSATHGRDPFPWQSRLAERVLEKGWPSLLDLPTSAGKTSALDIALYTLALQPELMPRRTLLVVDRRIVVDQGALHARRLLASMRNAKRGPVQEVADRLRALWNGAPDDDAFAIAVLRGGMPRDNDWARRPDQPVLGVSTVDQAGSRLLFRGYGIGPRALSLHAGLLGNDVLFLLDEVHLAIPFAQTLEAIESRYRRTMDGLPGRFRVVAMSATPRISGSVKSSFHISAEDRHHPVLSRRLHASKPVRLVKVKVSGDDRGEHRQAIAEAAIAEARQLLTRLGCVVGVVVNRVDTARRAYRHAVEVLADSADVVLLTGRMRPIDRDWIVHQTLLPRAQAGRDRTRVVRPFVVVATQCVEAGADLDFDGLVTECASLDALRQRFGRLNRLGELTESHGAILGSAADLAQSSSDPVYGEALRKTWALLEESAADGTVDFGVAAIDRLLKSVDVQSSGLLAPTTEAPILLPAHVDTLSQTSPLPDFGPDVALLLHGAGHSVGEVQLVWRSEVSLPQPWEDVDGASRRLTEMLSARRPSSLEAVSLPVWVARNFLQRRPVGELADVEGVAPDGEDAELGGSESQPLAAFRWRGDESGFVTAREVRPGDVLVVPCNVGGLDAANFDPDADSEVSDLGDVAQLRARGVAVLRLERRALRTWHGDGWSESPPSPVEEETSADFRERVSTWIAAWPSAPESACPATAEEYASLVGRLGTSKGLLVTRSGDAVLVSAPLPRERRRSSEVSPGVTEDDAGLFDVGRVTLRRHCGHVRDVARQFATSIGLGAAVVEDLVLAAWLHDVGKADARFQRWLLGGSEILVTVEEEPLAKSPLPARDTVAMRQARQRAGYPAGYRHELLSLALIRESEYLRAASDPDLVLHLIASHHGWCRPFPPFVDDPADEPVHLEHGGQLLLARTRHHLAAGDSGIADRYWRCVDRYGWWGVAWLEAVLRLADHRASEFEEDMLE